MSDIRATGLIDDFQRADEDPIQPPWYEAPGAANTVKISGGALVGYDVPPSNDSAYRATPVVLGPNVETWGVQGGSAALTDGWRFGFVTWESVVAGFISGYIAIPWDSTGGPSCDLRRYDSGSFTTIADGTVGANFIGFDNVIQLLRRNGDDIEWWYSSDGGATFNLQKAVTDTHYMDGPFVFVYGTIGVETGWGAMGGGRITRSRIIRYVSN